MAVLRSIFRENTCVGALTNASGGGRKEIGESPVARGLGCQPGDGPECRPRQQSDETPGPAREQRASGYQR